MYFSKVVLTLAAAATAYCSAVPVEARGSGGDSDCNGGSTGKCCPGGVISALNCISLDSSCKAGDAYCCNQSASGVILNIQNCGPISAALIGRME